MKSIEGVAALKVVDPENPLRFQNPPAFEQGTISNVVEHEVVAPLGGREILARVIDHPVCAERSDHLLVPPAADAGHLGSEGRGDLDRKRTDAA